jgi:hypothetical protein
VRSLPLALVALVVLVPGCFTDAPPLTSADAGDEDDEAGSSANDGSDDDASSMSSPSDDDGATSNGSGSMSSSATSPESTDDDGSTDDDDTDDDDTSTPCGGLGQPCCADDTCSRGECNGSACVVFRGAYMDTLPCEECIELDHLGTLPGCACDGFPTTEPFTVYTDTCMAELAHVDAAMSFCQADLLGDTSDSDWGGAFMIAGTSVCGEEPTPCVVENGYTGDCACPDAMDEIVVSLQGPCSSGGPGTTYYDLHLCSSNAVDPISFGGAFEMLDNGTCASGNPRAGLSCGCPDGFAQQGLRIISTETTYGSTLVFCVG